MVNFKAIIYVHGDTHIEHFVSLSQYRTWRLSRCPTEADKVRLSQHYNITARRGEKYVEELYNLEPGTMGGMHHIFDTTTRSVNYLKDQGLLSALAGDHFVILETNPARQYVAVTIYTETDQLYLTVNFNEPTIPVNVGAGLNKIPGFNSRH